MRFLKLYVLMKWRGFWWYIEPDWAPR